MAIKDPARNPLNNRVSVSAGTNDIRVPDLPQLADMIKENGFTDGLTGFDTAMEQWRQQLERTLNERLQGKAAGVSGGNP